MNFELWLPQAALGFLSFCIFTVYSIVYISHTSKTSKSIVDISKYMTLLRRNDMSNLVSIEKRIAAGQSKPLVEALKNYKNDIETIYRSEIAPEPEDYFSYEQLISIPGKQRLLNTLWMVPGILTLLSVSFYPIYMLLSGSDLLGSDLLFYVGVSISAVVLMVCVYALFRLLTLNAGQKSYDVLSDFHRALIGAIPTASSTNLAALMLEGTRKNTEAFKASASEIVQKVDQFTSERIIPAVAQSFENSIAEYVAPSLIQLQEKLNELATTVVETQENGMKTLVDSFSSKLGEITGAQISHFESTIHSVSAGFENVNTRLSNVSDAFANQLEQDRRILHETTEQQNAITAIQNTSCESISKMTELVADVQALFMRIGERDFEVFARFEETAGKVLTMQQQMNEFLERSQSTMDENSKSAQERFERQFDETKSMTEANMVLMQSVSTAISTDIESMISGFGISAGQVFEHYTKELMDILGQSVEANNITSHKLSETMEGLANIETEQYEKASKAAANLLENVVIEMNKAMSGVGTEIAESIGKASVNSAKIVEQLAEKTEELRGYYDLYFSRVDAQTEKNIDEIGYRMEAIFSRFSEGATSVMDKLEGNISGALGIFQGNTASLLEKLEEQSRSIGLYAKNLNIDIAQLTENLRESVGIFSEHLRDTTQKTFQEFDGGLSDVCARFANVIAGISDSVENLPKALKS